MNIVSTQSGNNEEGQTSVNEKRRIEKQKWVSCSNSKYSTFLTHLHSPLFVAPGSGCGPGLMEEKLTTRFNFVESTFYKWI